FSDDDYFYLMQFKYHDDPVGKAIQFSATGPGHQLVHCWPYVSDLNLASSELAQKRIRQSLYDISARFQDEVDVHGKTVKLVVIEWADGPVLEAEGSAKIWVDKLPIGHHVESFEVENFQSIRSLWEQRKAPVTRYQGTIDLPFLEDEGKIQLSTPHE